MVNLELYKVFYTVAKCGSLTRAAQELYISQPAVSQSIKQLENQLGVSLFNRTHRGMELSAAGGKLIFKKVEEAINLLESAENTISELQNTATGTIRIGATDSIFSHLLADKIAAYNEAFPAVKLELISSTSPDTLEKLKEGRCDIAFVNLPVEDDAIKFVGTVSHLSDVFVAGKKYESLKGETLPLKRLQEFPLLMIEENTIARRALSDFTQTLGINLHPDIELANWDLMLKLAIKGMGIGCIPSEYCEDLLESGELFEVKTDPSLPVRGVGIAVPKNLALSYALKQFIALFNK
ncbi:MAG: LysR family transcriptional regulator [Clostridia bacterium]|nr:LysR family transcriptional regulator [Clostridia bacterium]